MNSHGPSENMPATETASQSNPIHRARGPPHDAMPHAARGSEPRAAAGVRTETLNPPEPAAAAMENQDGHEHRTQCAEVPSQPSIINYH